MNDTKEITKGNLPINLKLTQWHKLVEPIIIAKYEDVTYHKGSFLWRQ